MASNVSFGGVREAMTCDVCLEVYDQARRTPLSLPCGHTFCRPCLVILKASRQAQCPTCRKQHNVQVEALPVNYSLLNITPLHSELQYEECTAHRDNIRYFCCTCGQQLCSLCLHSGHPQGHSVKLTQVFVQEEKVRLEECLKGVYRSFEEQKAKLKDDFKKLDTCMTELLLRRANMQNIAADLDDLLAKIQKAKDIATIKHLEKAVGNFCPAAKMLSPSGDKSTPRIMDDSREAAKLAQKKAPLGQQQHSSVPSQRRRETTKGPGPVMDFREGRLLLHSFPEPRSTGLSPQMSSEVFLELSVGGRCLGCIYITLWSHMRLAQQFLALCMGTAEQSLRGKKAHGKVRDIIEFRFGGRGDGMAQSTRTFGGHGDDTLNTDTVDSPDMFFPRGEGITQGLSHYCTYYPYPYPSPMRSNIFHGNASPPNQPNLEWGGTYAKPEAEGYIMRTDAKEGLAFGICTKSQHGVTAQAPFGMVVVGLDVAREAFLHDPVTAVTVTDCGLVLPFPSLVPT